MHDILSIGTATVDAFLTIPENSVHCHMDDKTCELSFPLGQKIPLENAEFLIGGNASNVSVGLSRLGLSAMLFAEIGNDEFAQKILRSLSEEHVNLSHVIQTETQSSFAMGLQYKGDRTLFVRHQKREHQFNFDVKAKWMYLSSLGTVWEEAYQKAYTAVLTHHMYLACNPGTLQIQAGFAKIATILSRADILFLNTDEAAELLGKKNQSVEELLIAYRAHGVKIVVLTDGKNGSYTKGPDGVTYHVGIANHPVVERTGAGDAYSSGFLAAIIHGHSTRDAMVWGTLNASSVVGKVGSQPGLLHSYEMIATMDEHKHTLIPKPV